MNRSTALSALIALAVVCASIASASDTVYVSERNGAAYHAADCQRLRFATPMPLTEASLRYRPCPVCQGQAKGPVAAPEPVQLMPDATPIAAPAPDTPPTRQASTGVSEPTGRATRTKSPTEAPARPSTSKRTAGAHRRGEGRWIGAILGGCAGFVVGYAIGRTEPCDLGEDGCGGHPTARWVGITLGGAVAGYALAGGFGHHSATVDRALERDRAAIRTAQARRPAPEPPDVDEGDARAPTERTALDPSDGPCADISSMWDPSGASSRGATPR